MTTNVPITTEQLGRIQAAGFTDPLMHHCDTTETVCVFTCKKGEATISTAHDHDGHDDLTDEQAGDEAIGELFEIFDVTD